MKGTAMILLVVPGVNVGLDQRLFEVTY